MTSAIEFDGKTFKYTVEIPAEKLKEFGKIEQVITDFIYKELNHDN